MSDFPADVQEAAAPGTAAIAKKLDQSQGG